MKNRIDSIQFLRAVAALLVVLAHTILELERQFDRNGISYTSYKSIASFGTIGVDVFFIISGFIMIYISSGQQSPSRFRFLLKRIQRVVPIYWLFTLLLLLLLGVKSFLIDFSGSQFGKAFDFEIDYILKSMIFFPAFNGEGKIFPVLGPGWTLNYEVFFYLVFVYLLPYKNKIFLLLAFFVSLIFGVYYFELTDVVSRFYSNPIIFEFLLGVVACELYLKGHVSRISKFSAVLITIFAVFFAFINKDIATSERWGRLLYFGLPSFLFFMSIMKLFDGYEFNKVIIFLGESSYSLYISHMVIGVPIIVKLLSFIGGLEYINYNVLIMMVLAYCIFVSSLTYIFIEKKIMGAFR